jgi:hypothetical protein
MSWFNRDERRGGIDEGNPNEHSVTESLLSRLPYAVDALFKTYSRQHDRLCLADTRVNLLRETHTWADGNDGRFIYWLNGLVGTGKANPSQLHHVEQWLALLLEAEFNDKDAYII